MSREPVFVGLDVSKATLDVARRPTGEAWQVANAETGLVTTMPRPEQHESPSGVRLSRLYIVEVNNLPGGQVEVLALPSVTETDMPGRRRLFTAPRWDLDEERAAWTRLFDDVRAIVERASP